MTRYACLPWNLKVLSHVFLLLSAASAESSATSLPSSTRMTSTVNPRVHISPTPLKKAPTSSSVSTDTCRSPSVNHITNRLPQQCWTGSTSTPTTDGKAAALSANGGPNVASIYLLANPEQTEARKSESEAFSKDDNAKEQPDDTKSTSEAGPSPSSTDVEGDPHQQIEFEAESPLDNAKFLSFEDWKRQKLEQTGAGPDALASERKNFPQDRQRPGFNNALDALSDDSEIAFNFNPFGGSNVPLHQPKDFASTTATIAASSGAASRAADMPHKRSKDAGKTCKERSNYASFDCAANVLKTNPKCKSASSILVENKDSYMLNECSMDNKFLIVELCENVLIDTVVLANFEFFSSIFRTFRISGSSHYPPKPDQWENIGTFEARNSREIQAFLVEPPRYARYLRVEFLTHYGSEYYCPVSLLRVHGMSMYEEFLEETQSTTESESDADQNTVTVVSEVKEDRTIAPEIAIGKGEENFESTDTSPTPAKISEPGESLPSATAPDDVCLSAVDLEPKNIRFTTHEKCAADSAPPTSFLKNEIASISPTSTMSVKPTSKSVDNVTPSVPQEAQTKQYSVIRATGDSNATVTSISSAIETSTSASKRIDAQVASNSGSPVSTFTATVNNLQPAPAPPPTYQPPTQESFFKSMHKRLQALEANATLSLQYIESQSALLRDAFAKVEKRQLGKTSTFLETLNITVTTELAKFKSEYDQLWQSAVMELASQREEGRRERELLGERIKVLAEEMVNQKRLMAAQATLLLLCLGLVIFGKLGGVAPSLDSGLIQGMQEIVMKAKEAKLQEAEKAQKPWKWDSPWSSPSKKSKNSAKAKMQDNADAAPLHLSNQNDGPEISRPASVPNNTTLNERRRPVDPAAASREAALLSVRSAPATPAQ